MADRQVFPVRAGSTHQLTLASPLASTFTATCTGAVYALPGGRNSNSYETASSATYTVTNFAGNATYGPGWYLTMADTVTDDLAPGVYLAIAEITYTAPSAWVDAVEWIIEVAA